MLIINKFNENMCASVLQEAFNTSIETWRVCKMVAWYTYTNFEVYLGRQMWPKVKMLPCSQALVLVCDLATVVIPVLSSTLSCAAEWGIFLQNYANNHEKLYSSNAIAFAFDLRNGRFLVESGRTNFN